MYTKIGSSMIYVPHFGVSLAFDLIAHEELVMFSVKSIRCEIDSFKAEAKQTRDKYAFVHAIGIGMEIVKNAIYMHIMSGRDIKLCKKTRSAIKPLVLEVNELMSELGKFDSDFVTDYATQRVRTIDDMLEFVSKKW